MKRFLFFAVVATLFAACSKDAISEEQGIQNIVDEAPATLTVGFEDDETRIQLNEDVKTVWTNGDLVSVFYRSDANQKWQYSGETGARTGSLKRVSTTDATTKLPKVVVVYPYNESYYINPVSCNIEATMPAEQTYLKDSYGLDGNIMVSSDEFNQISLKSVYGWLKLQLTGNGEQIKSITVRGNSGEQMAGLVYIDSSDATTTLAAEMGSADDPDVGGAGGNLVFEDTVLTEVTLNCLDSSSPTEKGVEVASTATAFYIALPPQTFTKGITVEITDTTNFTMTQSTDKEVVIERNHIKPMAAFKFVNPNTPTLPTPANNEIWYTATEKADPYFDDFLTFGSDVVSNVWDSETKRGIITFDGDVTMIGDGAFYNCDKLTSITLPESVTSIGKEAFHSCDGLTEFTIPDSVKTIGEDAFGWCSSLTSVTIGNSVTTIGDDAFSRCTELTSVTIPDSVTTIGELAFCACYKLTSVTIGNSVTTIGEWAFDDCSSLKEFKGKFAADGGRCLIKDNTIIAYANASGTTYTIPDSVQTIGEGAFSDCSLTSVTIPDSVTTVGDGAFYYCDSLTSVTIPDSVTSIGNSAFKDCKSLTSVTIGDSVTTIGEKAFYSCTSLKKVYCYATIPPSLGNSAFSSNAGGRRIYVYEECVELYNSAWSSYKDSIYTNGQNCPETTTIQYTTNDGNTITSSKLPIISNIYDNGVGTLVVVGKIALIPEHAFYNCTSLTSVNIPDSVTTIGDWAFYNCDRLTSVTIGKSVTTIGNNAFYECSGLTSVTIPDSVTTIGSSAFDSCISLTSVTIPDSVTTIGGSAFDSCISLTSVTIGKSVTTIGNYAFCSCDSLKTVYCKPTTPPAGDYSMFYANASDRKIYVPAGSGADYKAKRFWSDYADYIEEDASL